MKRRKFWTCTRCRRRYKYDPDDGGMEWEKPVILCEKCLNKEYKKNKKRIFGGR